ncbi:32861_t:CDS:2, partial [Gigaspora margarita]
TIRRLTRMHKPFIESLEYFDSNREVGTSKPNCYSSNTQEKSSFHRVDINDDYVTESFPSSLSDINSMHDNPFTQNFLNTSSEYFKNSDQDQIRRPQPDNYNSITQEITSSRATINTQDTV